MGGAETSTLGWPWYCLTLCRETDEKVARRKVNRELSKWKDQQHTGIGEVLVQISFSKYPHYSAEDLVPPLESWSEVESVRTPQFSLTCRLPDAPSGDFMIFRPTTLSSMQADKRIKEKEQISWMIGREIPDTQRMGQIKDEKLLRRLDRNLAQK